VSVSTSVCEVEDRERLAEWLAVRNELEPDEPLPLEQLLARRAAEPQRRELLATVGGDIAGIGSVGPKGDPPELAHGHIGVRDAFKGQGVEAALLAEIRKTARSWSRSSLGCGRHGLARPGLYEHGLLAVLPEYRGRGIVRALKIAQLRWLREHQARRARSTSHSAIGRFRPRSRSAALRRSRRARSSTIGVGTLGA
jgi:GNAT superfamily N-acetyltransferase